MNYIENATRILYNNTISFTINPKAQTLNQVFTPYLQKKWIECKQIQNSALSKQDLTEASNNTKFHFQQEWSQFLKKYQCNAIPCGLYNMVTFGIK